MRSARERAYEFIRHQVEVGTLAPGARVSDDALGKVIGVSRAPIREAMGRLASEGLLEQIPYYGTFVRKLDANELGKLYELREVLEGYAAARAATRLSEDDLGSLTDSCDALLTMARRVRKEGLTEPTAAEAQTLVELDVTFHMRIVHASGNEWIAKAISDYRILSRLCGVRRVGVHRDLASSLTATWRDHYRILRALRRRDPDEAQRWVAHHIAQARRGVLGTLAKMAQSDESTRRTWPGARSVFDIVARIERYQDS